jgi:hypothetical protein
MIVWLVLVALGAVGAVVFFTCENGVYGKEPPVIVPESPVLYVRNKKALKEALERTDITAFTVDVSLNTDHEITVSTDKVVTLPAGVVVVLKSLTTKANVKIIGPAASWISPSQGTAASSEADDGGIAAATADNGAVLASGGSGNGEAGVVLIKNSFNVETESAFNLIGNAKLAFYPAVTADNAVVDGVLTAEIEDSILWIAEGEGGEARAFTGAGSVQTSGDATPAAAVEIAIEDKKTDALPFTPPTGKEEDEEFGGVEGKPWQEEEEEVEDNPIEGEWPSVKATKITPSNSSLKLGINETAQLEWTLEPADSDDVLMWASSKPGMVSVSDSGYVTAKSQGIAQIMAKAKAGGVTASYTVEVAAGQPGLFENDEFKDVTGMAGNNLLEKSFNWIKEYSTASYEYTIVLDEDISVGTGFNIGSGVSNSSTGNVAKNYNLTITLKGLGQTRTITKTATGAMFTVYGASASDVPHLILGENITLSGYDKNNVALVIVGNLANTKMGELTMLDGSRITGNTNSVNTSTGGVLIWLGGIFTMNGGSIDDNHSTAANGVVGGAVLVNNSAEFKMTGGVIAKNSAKIASNIGAVTIGASGKFTKKGGGIIYGQEGAAGDNANTCVNAVYRISAGTKYTDTVDEATDIEWK